MTSPTEAHMTDAELFALMDGDAPSAGFAAAHLRTCAECADRLRVTSAGPRARAELMDEAKALRDPHAVAGTISAFHPHIVFLDIGGVLYDDRTESAGVKFNDADLIGLPCESLDGESLGSVVAVDSDVAVARIVVGVGAAFSASSLPPHATRANWRV